MTLALALIIIALFTAADYVTGRDFFSKAHIPGRSIWYTTPVVMLALWFMHPVWAWVGLSWGLWRGVLGWSTFGARMDSRTGADNVKMFARDVVSTIAAVAAFVLTVQATALVAIGVVGLFCGVATAVNSWYGYNVEHGHDVGPAVDVLHGAAFGLAVVGVILLS